MALEIPDLGYTPTIPVCVRRAAEKWPDRDFVVLPDKRITFGEMEIASRRLGKKLLAAGLGKGSRIGIWDTYSVEWAVAWFAIMRIGGVAMPFSSVYKPAELRTALRLGDVQTFLVTPEILGKSVLDMIEEALPDIAGADREQLLLEQTPYLRQVWVWGEGSDRSWVHTLELPTVEGDDPVSDAVYAAVESEVTPADWAQVTYTSGSTALPKGVVHSHGAIVRTTGAPTTTLSGGPTSASAALAAAAAAAGMGQDDAPVANFCAFPFFWIGGTLVLGGAIQAGRTVVCLPRFEPAAALDIIERERCVGVTGWTTITGALRGDPSFAGRDLSFNPTLSSETGINPALAAFYTPPAPGLQGHRSMSELVGNWAGSERHAIDPDTGEVLGDMEEGELVVRGFGMMQGYYKKEREETFDENGWLHTGDRIVMADNRPWFVGRFSQMIKSGGSNVSPLEVEASIEAWPEIRHCFVYGIPHAVREEEVCAVIAFMPGMSMTSDEIRSRAAKELSSYKVPTRIEIVEDDSTLPWLGSGKPDKLTLRARTLEQLGLE